MKKLHKRPLSKQELSFAMGTTICVCTVNCRGLDTCNCTPTPTHQIAFSQVDQDRTTESYQQAQAAKTAAL